MGFHLELCDITLWCVWLLTALQPSSVGQIGHLPAPFGGAAFGDVGHTSAKAACRGLVPQEDIQVASLKGWYQKCKNMCISYLWRLYSSFLSAADCCKALAFSSPVKISIAGRWTKQNFCVGFSTFAYGTTIELTLFFKVGLYTGWCTYVVSNPWSLHRWCSVSSEPGITFTANTMFPTLLGMTTILKSNPLEAAGQLAMIASL